MACFAESFQSADAADIDFSHEIAPLLKQQCGKCHTGTAKKGGFSLNTRETLMAGGESGAAVVAGMSGKSELIKRLLSDDKDLRMPPEGPRLPVESIAKVKTWIDADLPWEAGFSFAPKTYDPPLRPRRPELPLAVNGRTNPIDRIIDAYLAQHKLPRPKPIDDGTFARRVYMDIIGLLPSPEELQGFLDDGAKDKREKLVQSLLSRNADYAEHWLTFWNDLLRNDYTGTGFITGGRKQISRWLYDALLTNKSYDQFARELIAPPTDESRGFIDGIKWRGEVSAGQTVEIQFAQSVSQSLLGLNLKCASCHDSFIDRWTLEQSYGLAAIYSTRPLEIHRCDKPIGKMAQASWLFPEIGQVDAAAKQPERLKQLAALMTHPDNGRFTRTIVNRIWHRMMGRGIVHPTNAMQTEPWNADLLDELAVNLADKKYDLKQTISLIANSAAYQSEAQIVHRDTDDRGYTYAGPRAKRLTAEQFIDAVWQLTDTAPAQIDAPVVRGFDALEKNDSAAPPVESHSKWVWNVADSSHSPAGETLTFRKTLELKQTPTQAAIVITCDNSFSLIVNGKKVHAGENWETPELIPLASHLKAGKNEILIIAKNGGSGPNPAALFCEGRINFADKPAAKGKKDPKAAKAAKPADSANTEAIVLDESWEWTKSHPDDKGKFKTLPDDWQPAVPIKDPSVWTSRVGGKLSEMLSQISNVHVRMVRASLVKSDFLMRSLGRPNRDQIVNVRPEELTTLEAISLSNGQTLADALSVGSKKLLAISDSPDQFIHWMYRAALSRNPHPAELAALTESIGSKLTEQNIQDTLWSVLMLPEFQLVR